MWAKRLTTVVLGTALFLTACHKRAPVAAVHAPALPPPSVSALDQADLAFNAGNYDEAARAYENFMRLAPSGGQRDHALFHLALTYALRTNPSPDWQRSSAFLKQLVQEFPNSPLKAPAALILSLRSEVDQLSADTKSRDARIRQLSGELDRLKKIDAERRKRP